MRWVRFSMAVTVTSLALVAVLVAGGGLLVRNALASGQWFGPPFGPPFGAHGAGPWGKGFDHPLPPELAGLGDLPAGERFAHFLGVQVRLKDADGRPVTVDVTPGTATAVSATSLTVAANDGSTRTVALDAQTRFYGKGARDGGQAAGPAAGEQVVVVTVGDSATARLVVAPGAGGFQPGGPFGHRR